MVGGGAKHSTNIARLLAYAAFAGREGIITPKDLEVRALAVPGPQIRVFPGGASILNRAANIRQEAYVGRLPIEDVKDVTATGGTGRSDLVVARVENPWIESEPWDEPVDPEVGPYIFSRIIEGVPATTKTAKQLGLPDSMIELARLDIPVSTGTIQQAHIVDLRKLCQVLREREQNIAQPTGNDTLFEASPGRTWPAAIVSPTTVPEWATRCLVHGQVAGATMAAGNFTGYARVNLGGTVASGVITGGVATQSVALDFNAATTVRVDVHAGGSIAIPASMRGQSVTIQIQAWKTGGSVNLVSNPTTTAWLDLEYSATPETNV
jgi:hypothetical protein